MIESWSIYNINKRKRTEKLFFEICSHRTNYSQGMLLSLLGLKERLGPFRKLNISGTKS